MKNNEEKLNNAIKKENIKKHNNIIGFWKFIFSIIIVIYHINLSVNYKNIIFKYGYIAVEFFFLVSGYLLAKSAMNQKDSEQSLGNETFNFIWKKIKAFFPYIFIAYVATLFANIWANGMYNKRKLTSTVLDLFFLQASGIEYTMVLTHLWYISAMLISMIIIYPLLRKYKENFIYIIAPIITIFIGAWISHNYGTVNGWEYTGLVYKCLLRAFFEISLGTILYEIAEKIKLIKFTKVSKFLLTLIGIGGFISVIFIANINKPKLGLDFVMILFLAISVTIAFSEKTLLYNVTNKKFIMYIEKLSLPIYINHAWIITIISKIFPQVTYSLKIVLVIAITIIFSMIINFIIDKIKNNKKFTSKIKKCFVAND